MKGANNTYWGNVAEGIKTLSGGFSVTVKHFFQSVFKKRRKSIGAADDNYFSQQSGIVTLQYPHESIPVPDNGRYRLHNEIDDCIVCDKCAKVCPVNCIDIEPVKSTEEIRKTSDGSSVRLYAAKFDIDMAKCCYCGLCTTVCPTECLTMTKTYDYSEFDIRDMNYKFSDMTPEQAQEKQADYDKAMEEKARLKAQKSGESSETKSATPSPKISGGKPKPVFKPKIAGLKTGKTDSPGDEKQEEKKAVAKPVIKKKEESNKGEAPKDAKPKPVIKPVIKKKADLPKDAGDQTKPKPVIKPVIKKPSSDKTSEGKEKPKDEGGEEV